MKPTSQKTLYLKDYKPFGYCIDGVELEFFLSPTNTRVKSRILFRPNPATDDRTFFLHGEGLKLLNVAIDHQHIQPELTDAGLLYDAPKVPFLFEAEVEINPAANSALEGLYMSKEMYCTQCEAEGFRKITYYPDRPDIMAIFTVKIKGSQKELPVLLSNGNLIETGTDENGLGFATWEDPWPKPSYLFALVAGNLVRKTDQFVTSSNQQIALSVWVRPGDEHKCAFAIESLKKAMHWDEEVYGREYDLEEFNIVAVDDFNMGAMENKGLNIFNASAVLTSPETATDTTFERVEAIIAHEYFHNWTGNRITCRDWFQLCLKEGLTVFRDAQFSASVRSEPIKRISDVIELRARQFPEDQGPLSHPVRPEYFQEINNFYTATVYEKGAEVIGMLKRLVGDENYSKALNLYFTRHDGQACTVENWLSVFEDTINEDLTQFKRWYSQAGTPRLVVTENWQDNMYTLDFEQHLTASSTTPDPKPFVIPICVGLLSADGNEVVPTTLLKMTKQKESFSFKRLSEKPIPSILRGFSAPVILERPTSKKEHLFLLKNDTDYFNRWESARALAQTTLLEMSTRGKKPSLRYFDAIKAVLQDDHLEPAFRAQLLEFPGQADLAGSIAKAKVIPDPEKIWKSTETLKDTLAKYCQDILFSIYKKQRVSEPYQPSAEQIGKRALANATLALITRLDEGKLAKQQFASATNMTQQLSALGCLISAGVGDEQIKSFYVQWQHDRLMLSQWFALQIVRSIPQSAVAITRKLTQHPKFQWKNPNMFRAVIGSLSLNHAGFHTLDGSGYYLFADWLTKLDPINPQTTARACAAFQTWKQYDDKRQSLMKKAMEQILVNKNLSNDTNEMLDRILSA
ncbi:MAG: aminopeptidase N [Aestuariivita sp.]|nr:aminopeptidase N [Aestuariivita sp.]